VNVAPVTKQLGQAQIDRYAEASGDHNPIHVDPDFARATPFGGTIAHGMLVLASIAEMMTAACGEAFVTKGKLRVRFRAPARSSATITARAVAARDGVYNVEVRDDAGELLISGTASDG
jgi:3-hydroxybutyryl-CoA dehydratase